MIPVTGSTRILLYNGVTDMRKSFDGLSGIIRQFLDEDPLSGALFVFCNRRRNRLKILYWDGDGYALWYKRLEQGTFNFPESRGGDGLSISSRDLAMLLEGIIPLRVTKRYSRK